MAIRRYKNCAWCSERFSIVGNSRYCSATCALKAEQDKLPKTKSTLNTGQRGAVSELYVCADLILKGFSVFRSVSQTCPCDLVAMSGDKLYRVEVKTVAWVKGLTSVPTGHANNKHLFDIYAAVDDDGNIVYVPDVLLL